MFRSKKLWTGTLAASIAATLGLALFTSSAAPAKGPVEPAKIKMVFDPQQGPPAFVGDDTVFPGQDLKIVNRTNPQQIGPHTFSLIEEGSIPVTPKDQRKCSKIELPVCANIFRTHDVSRKFVVRKPNVDKGLEGWDRSFNDEIKGDSWFTEKKRGTETRAVTATPGSTLCYFCLVHPEMQGSVGVQSR